MKLLKTKEGVIPLKDGDIAVGNVLTAGLLKKQNCCIISTLISWEEFDEYKKMVENNKAINFMGHPSTAKLVGMEANRVSLQADYGSTLVVTQYDGPRLNEGVTDLPEGATLLPTQWEVLDIPKFMIKIIKIWNKIIKIWNKINR